MTHQLTSETIRSRRETLAAEVVARQYALAPERWAAYGVEGRQKSLRDARYHLDYLAEAIEAQDESLFLDYVGWARTLFSKLNLGNDALAETLRSVLDALSSSLPPAEAATTHPYLAGALALLQRPASIPPTFIRADAPLASLAQSYLESLLSSDRRQASTLILQAAGNGAALQDIYLHVFQPAQRELGRLWQLGEIGVAQEHLATAITQFTMSELYPRIFAAERCGKSLLAACVGDELHELGIRMVADFFEMQGWDTYYLGANTPSDAIVSAVRRHRPDVLALSVTMTFHVRTAAGLVAELRAQPDHGRMPVLVGGYPFNISPRLWQHVGADAMAPDAHQAVDAAHRLVSQNPQ